MDRIEIHILRNLYNRQYIGRRYTDKTHLQQGLPKHERGMSAIEKAVKRLIKSGYLILYKGRCVSLNPDRKYLSEVEKVI